MHSLCANCSWLERLKQLVDDRCCFHKDGTLADDWTAAQQLGALLEKAEKDGDISQDDQKLYADEVQSLTDKYVSEIDETAKQKDAEILQV